jgi:acyl carrier protein
MADAPAIRVPDVLPRLLALLAAFSGHDRSTIAYTSTLVGDLGLDSLDLVQVQQALEAEFGMEFPDDEMQRLVTVANLDSWIINQLPTP